MSPLPKPIIAILLPFAGLFSATVWTRAQVLVIGAILCQGPRTVAAALRVMGLGQEPRFERYQRVLSRACRSGLQAAKMLVGLVIQLLPWHWIPLLVVDDTVERRRGKRIHAKGCYRDPVRSTAQHVVKCFGLKWLSLRVLVRLPWCSRPWALPVLTVLGHFLKRLYLGIQSIFLAAKGARSNHPGATRHPSLSKEGNPTPHSCLSGITFATNHLNTRQDGQSRVL